LFSGLALVSQSLTRSANAAEHLKDQPMLKVRWSVLALAGLSVVLAPDSHAVTFHEDFATDPSARGWTIAGDTNLFHWNSTDQNLVVRWDSSQPNSYFCHPLGGTLGVDDDFSVSFDLRITNAVITPYGFEMAISFLNLADATGPTFLRGTGVDSPNVVEFDYFPDPDGILDWGPSITTMMVDSVGTTSSHWSRGWFAPLAMPLNDQFHVEMVYTASDHTLRTSITDNGLPFGPVPDAYLPATFLSFRVDHLAIASYSDANGWGSLLADGIVDNLTVTATPRAAQRVSGSFVAGGVWQAQFLSHTNWLYTLERTTNFQSWTPVSETRRGNENDMALQDTNAPATGALYRVRTD
jgi:hypothetical protein